MNKANTESLVDRLIRIIYELGDNGSIAMDKAAAHMKLSTQGVDAIASKAERFIIVAYEKYSLTGEGVERANVVRPLSIIEKTLPIQTKTAQK